MTRKLDGAFAKSVSAGRDPARLPGDAAWPAETTSLPEMPARVLTVVLYAYASNAAPQWFAANRGADTDRPALRLVANAVLFTQAWGNDIVPFSNSPFWSLSYEAGFYIPSGPRLPVREQGAARSNCPLPPRLCSARTSCS